MYSTADMNMWIEVKDLTANSSTWLLGRVYICLGVYAPYYYLLLGVKELNGHIAGQEIVDEFNRNAEIKSMTYEKNLYLLHMTEVSKKDVKITGRKLYDVERVRQILAQRRLCGHNEDLSRLDLEGYWTREKVPCVEFRNIRKGQLYIEEKLAYAIRKTHVLHDGDEIWMYQGVKKHTTSKLEYKYETVELDSTRFMRWGVTKDVFNIDELQEAIKLYGFIREKVSVKQKHNFVALDNTYVYTY